MIYKDNRQNIIEIDSELEDLVSDIICYALKEEGVLIPCEVSLVYIDDKGIWEINKEYRNVDRATDVLSFPMLEYRDHKVFKDLYKEFHFTEDFLDEGMLVLGDIVLSLERAKEQAVEYGHDFKREVCYLVVHSVLHLLGYDHMEEGDKLIMRGKEEEILMKFSISR